MLPGKVGVGLEEIPVVHDGADDVVHVVGGPGVVRDDGVQGRRLPSGRVGAGRDGRVFHVVVGQKGEQPLDLLDGVGVGLAGEVGHPALRVVGHGAAQVLEADLLPGDALDDVGPGDEHVGGVLHHEDEVRHGRGVDRAPGGGAHDGGDLGDDPAGDGVPVEDLPVGA